MGREEEQAEHELRQAQPCPQVYTRQNQNNQAEKYKGRLFTEIIILVNSVFCYILYSIPVMMLKNINVVIAQ